MKRISKILSLIMAIILVLPFFACNRAKGRTTDEWINLYAEKLDEAYATIERDIVGYKLIETTGENTQILPENEVVISGDTKFSFEIVSKTLLNFYYGYITITKINEDKNPLKETTIFIDEDYILEKCAKARQILDKKEELNLGDLKHVPTALMEFDNKLFIYCKGYVYLYSAIFLTGLKLSFPTIFVFDLESETIEYAGYLKTNPRKDTLSLSIVKE